MDMPSRPQQTMRRRFAGFSMVELLVSTALTLLLTGGIVAVFIGSRTTQNANERFAQVQETARLALDLMARDIRAAGYGGCVSRPRYVNSSLDQSGSDSWNFVGAPIHGYEGTALGASHAPAREALAFVASESDALLLRAPVANARTLRLQRDMASDDEPLFVGDADKANWRVGDIVLAHSCEAHSYFAVSRLEATEVHHDLESDEDGPAGTARLNSTASLGYTFSSGAELTPVATVVYYVSPSVRRPSESTLWRRAGRQSAEEIAAGVEQMQLQFGVDQDGDAAVDSYVDADAVEDWRTVRSVSVMLVIRALDSSQSDTATHPRSSEPAGEDEESKRQTFSTVVSLRNYSGGLQ